MILYFYKLAFITAIFFLTASLGVRGNFIYSIVSYNIKFDDGSQSKNSWKNRKDGMIKLINSLSPDIVGTQEGLIHQIKFLDVNLNKLTYVGVGREDGNKKGEFCAIFFNKYKYNLLDASTFWLSNTPEKVSIGWDAALERICTYALLETIEGKDKIWVFNTHFDHLGNVAREESAKLLLEKITSLNLYNYPVILMGDFNATKDSKVISILRKYLTDTMLDSDTKHRGPNGTFNNFLNKQNIIKRIDYVFSRSFKTISHQHIYKKLENGNHISDHLPVFVKVKKVN